MGAQSVFVSAKDRGSRARKTREVKEGKNILTKQHSRALFALRMQDLIMFDVPFSHYLVCSSVVQVKSSAKDQHSKTLKPGCQHISVATNRCAGGASCLLQCDL